MGPPKHALMAIIGNPILATVILATKSPRLLPYMFKDIEKEEQLIKLSTEKFNLIIS